MAHESAASSVPEGGCSREVEWQVAFFWLVCLALKSMTQPSGRVCEFHPKYRFILRSSPFICAFDAVGVLLVWARHICWHLESPTTAARRIARARFRDIENEAEEESVSSLERNIPFRYVAFFLGALPQAVKLFASSGLPYVKAIGAMYLGSWILFELLLLPILGHDRHKKAKAPAQVPSTERNHHWKRLRAAWRIAAVVSHTVCFSILSSLHLQRKAALWQTAFLLTRTSWLLAAWLYFVTSDVDYEASQPALILKVWTVYFVFFTIIEGFLMSELVPSTWYPMSFLFTVIIYSTTPPDSDLVLLLQALIPARLMPSWVPTHRGLWTAARRKVNVIAWMLLILFINLLTGLMYFAWIYSPVGTSTPKWTSWLG
jgi:hypothetical protein